jgi:hypothetical protein
VNSSQATAGHTSFWDMVIDNYDGTNGLNLFGGDMMVLDNQGGANAALTIDKTFTWVWCPSPILNTAWNNTTTGPFATSVGINRNARFQFRVLDVISNGGITAGDDSGRLCLKDVIVEAIPYSALSLTQDFALTSALTSANLSVNPVLGSTATFASGYCTLMNVSGSQSAEYVSIFPGDSNIDFNTPSTLLDNYPVVWQSNKLYQVIWNLSAPDANSETHGYDVFWTSMDACTSELIEVSYVTAAQNFSGMPKQGTPQQWMSFLYSHNETLSSVTQYHRLRPRIEFGNVPALTWPDPNNGGVRIHGVTVNTVVIP